MTLEPLLGSTALYRHRNSVSDTPLPWQLLSGGATLATSFGTLNIKRPVFSSVRRSYFKPKP